MRQTGPHTNLNQRFKKQTRKRDALSTHRDLDTFVRYMKRNCMENVTEDDLWRLMYNMKYRPLDDFPAYKEKQGQIMDQLVEAGLNCENMFIYRARRWEQERLISKIMES
jgi:hypothetical protein